MSHIHHQQYADQTHSALRCAVLTISDTRTVDTDTGGQLAQRLLRDAGHDIGWYTIVKDEPAEVVRTVSEWVTQGCQVVITTGGTGMSKRDTTVDALLPHLERVLPGFGELFRMLSYAQVGAAAMLSRAVAGTWQQTVVFCLPGSPAAVDLGMTQLIVPELRHMYWEMTRHAQA